MSKNRLKQVRKIKNTNSLLLAKLKTVTLLSVTFGVP